MLRHTGMAAASRGLCAPGSPTRQRPDSEAREMTEDFIKQYARTQMPSGGKKARAKAKA